MKNRINWTAAILIAIGSLFILFPLYMAVVVAVKNPAELAQSILSPPTKWHLENFTRAIAMTDFFQSLANSTFITVIAVTFTLLTNSMVAYAIARNLHKRFFKFLYYYFISAMFIPFPLIMLPIVKLTSTLEMNHPLGLAFLYIVYGLSLNIFIYVGYIRSIPKELEEAAIMDGASTWEVFWKVVFPLLAPINATVGILTCLWTWNDFMLPLIILNEPEMATLPLKQYIFQGQFSTDYNTAFASYLLALSPLVLVYLFAQKWIINGVTKGAVK
jgi:raffinose/stachyose/melibiose transport system permease protein